MKMLKTVRKIKKSVQKIKQVSLAFLPQADTRCPRWPTNRQFGVCGRLARRQIYRRRSTTYYAGAGTWLDASEAAARVEDADFDGPSTPLESTQHVDAVPPTADTRTTPAVLLVLHQSRRQPATFVVTLLKYRQTYIDIIRQIFL